MSSAETRSARAGRPAAREKRRLRKTKTPGVYWRVDRDGMAVGYVAVIVVAGWQAAEANGADLRRGAEAGARR